MRIETDQEDRTNQEEFIRPSWETENKLGPVTWLLAKLVGADGRLLGSTPADERAQIRNVGLALVMGVLFQFMCIDIGLLAAFRPVSLLGYSAILAATKRHDVVRILDEIAAKTPVRANRAMAAIKKLFSWCVDRGAVEYNPLSGLKPPTKEVPRDRVLSDKELAACWLSAEQKGTPFEQLVKLLILTGQRRGEVSGMRWSEIDFERGIWTIPSKRHHYAVGE